MLPECLRPVILDNIDWFSDNIFDENEEFLSLDELKMSGTLKQKFNKLKVGEKNYTFMYFFCIAGLPPIGQGEELYNVDLIVESQNIEFFQNHYDIGKKFLQFSSIEGGGSYFYNLHTDEVYDVEFGQLEDMICGKTKPWFRTFYNFLDWYYSDKPDPAGKWTSG